MNCPRCNAKIPPDVLRREANRMAGETPSEAKSRGHSGAIKLQKRSKLCHVTTQDRLTGSIITGR